VLQECEFLVSLGFTEKAADVLRAYVDRLREPPALALLELRHLCAEADDAEGVAAAEEEFRERFGEEPPRDDATSGLEACEPALARIMVAWPQTQVLALIEELLFGPPAVLGGFPSLQAWRDLLWLHELAQDTLRGAEGGGEEVATSADGLPEMTLESLNAIDIESAQDRFGVDINLNEVDLDRHKVLDLQRVPRLPPLPDVTLEPQPEPEPAPPPKPHAYEDFYEAVGAAEGRALHIR
jgi:hypothetical protein